jgi:alpha-1,6-mannosyltransferase
MVFLSYITYANPSFKENLWVISIEYFVVFGFLIREIVKITSSRQESVKNVSLKD